jgi:hypothetical protein
MTTLTQTRSGSIVRTAVTLLAAIAVAIVAAEIIALSAVAAGATAFPPLMPLVFGPFAAIGILAGYAGWRIVRSRVRDPRRVLRVLVPVVLVLSFVPDITLMLTQFIPGTSTLGVVALMLMHLTVAGIVVPVSARLAPV